MASRRSLAGSPSPTPSRAGRRSGAERRRKRRQGGRHQGQRDASARALRRDREVRTRPRVESRTSFGTDLTRVWRNGPNPSLRREGAVFAGSAREPERLLGNSPPAAPLSSNTVEDRRLCVTALRRVCLCQRSAEWPWPLLTGEADDACAGHRPWRAPKGADARVVTAFCSVAWGFQRQNRRQLVTVHGARPARGCVTRRSAPARASAQ